MAIIYTNEAGETVVEYQDAVLGLLDDQTNQLVENHPE